MAIKRESGTNLRGKGTGREAELRNGALALSLRHILKAASKIDSQRFSFSPFFYFKKAGLAQDPL
jgi:hypothetical protein